MTDDSRRTYATHLLRFPEYFEQLGYGGEHCSSAITREMVLRFKFEGVGYRGKNRGQPLASGTRAMDLSLLRSFLAWERSELALDQRLFRLRSSPTNRRWLEGKKELTALMNAADTEAFRAALALMGYGGLRSTEVHAALVADLSLVFNGRSTVKVRKGKGDEPRTVVLPPLVRNVLLAAIAGKKAPEQRIYAWSRAKLAEDLDRACRKAGTVHYSPDDLRRTYAALMHQAGVRIEEIRQQMGHANIGDTRAYIGPVDATKAVDQFEAYLTV